MRVGGGHPSLPPPRVPAIRSPLCIVPAECLLKIGGQVSTCVAVTPVRRQRNVNLCGSPRSSSESRRSLRSSVMSAGVRVPLCLRESSVY
jgi:hypothetical protein